MSATPGAHGADSVDLDALALAAALDEGASVDPAAHAAVAAWLDDARARSADRGAPVEVADERCRALLAADSAALDLPWPPEALAPALAAGDALVAADSGADPGAERDRVVRSVLTVAPAGAALAATLARTCRPGDWDVVAVVAAVTAGLAAARVRGHDHDRALAVLAMVATGAPQLDAGADTPKVLADRAAGSAARTVVAVAAAEAGLTGPARPLGGERGLLAVLTRPAHEAEESEDG
jgi:hypothetical protein